MGEADLPALNDSVTMTTVHVQKLDLGCGVWGSGSGPVLPAFVITITIDQDLDGFGREIQAHASGGEVAAPLLLHAAWRCGRDSHQVSRFVGGTRPTAWKL